MTNTGSEQPGSFSYEYDSNGNMTKDSRKALEFSHNVLNLPMTASSLAGSTVTNTMTYTYLGDGTRVGARVSNPDAQGYSGMRYRGSFVYDVTADGVHSLQSIAVSTGRLIALTGTNGTISFESDGFITDHLGNVAAVVILSAPASTSNANVILEQDEYYPFGTKMEAAGMKTQPTNRYRYAGKEEQDIAGMDLDLLDFGARYYDAFVGRWNAIDPLAHKYFGMSPYNYCGNDPVNKFDPDGRAEIVARVVIGAIVGAVVEGTVAVLEGDKSAREVLGAAGKGAVEGAVIGATLNPEAGVAAGAAVSAGKGALAGALSGAAGSVVEQSISDGAVDGKTVLNNGIAGAISGGIAGGICGAIENKCKTMYDNAISEITSSAGYEKAKQAIKDGLKQVGVQIGKGTKNEIERNAKKAVSEAVEKEKAMNNFMSATSQYTVQEGANAATGLIMENL